MLPPALRRARERRRHGRPDEGRSVRTHRGAARRGRAALVVLAFATSAAPAVATARAVASVAPLVKVAAAPKAPAGSRDLGALDPERRLTIGVALTTRHPERLEEAAAAESADHGVATITPAEFAAEFGATARTIRTVSEGLRRLGVEPGAPSANGLVIPVTATVGRLARAFDTRIDAVRLADGTFGWSPERAPVLPAAIAHDVSAVLGLANLASPHALLVERSTPPSVAPSHREEPRARPSARDAARGGTPSACPAAQAAAASGGGWTDDDVARAYGLNHLYAEGDLGAGQTVAIFELEPFATTDIATFDRCYFGESHTNDITTEALDGFALSGQGDGEAVLDVENVSALAPAAHIIVYEAPNTSFGAIDEYNAIVSEDRANIISTSWGECEEALDASAPGARGVENAIFEEAALQGQTVVAASGDDGSDDCANTAFGSTTAVHPYLSVDDPASQPYVLAVGGTTLASDTPPLSAHGETVWNDGPRQGAGGGGYSSTWPLPAWQADSGVPGVPTSGTRAVPDVSATADQARGITVFSAAPASAPTGEGAPTGGIGWSTIGGTSSAAPIWAAVLAEIAASGSTGTRCSALPVTPGGSDLGFVAPDLYAVADTDYAGAFHDITTGSNDAFEIGDGFDATPGFDPTSGLGSPIVVGTTGSGGLASDLCAVATGATPQVPGRPVVTAVTPASGPISGGSTVTIALQSPVPSGVTVEVTFGSAPATVTSASGTSIVVRTPAAPVTPGAAGDNGAGPAAVTVEYSGTTGFAASLAGPLERYEYVALSSSGAVTPTVTGVGPAGGAPGGGEKLTIYGSGFAESVPTVTIGGVAATGVTVLNDAVLEAIVPPLGPATACATGAGFDPNETCQAEVVVTTAVGSSPVAPILPQLTGAIVFTPQGVVSPKAGTEITAATTEFDYSPTPVITGVTPELDGVSGNSPVTITGAGFGLNSFEWVNFGPPSAVESEQLKILSITPTAVEIDPPSAPTRSGGMIPGGVSVATLAGVSNAVPFGYAGIPTVRTLSTRSGPSSGGTRLTLTGRGLTGVTSVRFVSAISPDRFGQAVTHRVTVLGANRLRVTTPSGLIGPVDVEPCTPSGCAVRAAPADLFEFYSRASPVVASASPHSGSASGGEVVTLVGTDLAGAIAVLFGTRSTSAFVPSSGAPVGAPDTLAVHAPPGEPGTTVAIVVVTRAGRSAKSGRATFTYSPSANAAERR